MKQYFNKCKNKATFVSVAFRDTKSTWKNAIAKHEMSWTNFLCKDENLTRTYGIEGYPTKIIINPDGIVKIFLKLKSILLFFQLQLLSSKWFLLFPIFR